MMNAGAVPIQLPVRRFGQSSNSFRFPGRYARFGDFDLDLERQELYRGSVRIKLQTKVFEALLALLEAPGDAVSREAIRHKLWPGDSLVNFDANVNTTVNKLRQVLGDSPEQPAYVETIPRKGYCFVAKVAFVDELPSLPPAERVDAAASRAGDSASAGETSKLSAFLRNNPAKWLVAGVVTLVLSGALFGAAIMLYSHRVH
jgi:DNA-binding winged helix-turn-helix (wHTH) protein